MSTQEYKRMIRRGTIDELIAWYNGGANWGFHVRTPTRVLLRLYRMARRFCIYTGYYNYLDCYEDYQENKTEQEALVERIRDQLKTALDNREHVYSKGGGKTLRKIMAKHKLSKKQATVLSREHGIRVS